jgi:hypothetical protein
MNTDTYVAAAVGGNYLRLAEYQRRCMVQYGWTARHVIIAPEPGSWRGRDEKTGFAAYLPHDCDGRVILWDADCMIRGPQPEWDCVADVMGVGPSWDGKGHHGFKDAPFPECGRIDTMCLVFSGVESAKRISAKWLSAWKEGVGKENVWSDTYAFQFAVQGERCAVLPGATGSRPHPSILHRYTEAGGRQPRPPP